MADVVKLEGFETVGSQEEMATLYAKLSGVMAGIEGVPKNGRHPQGYNYVLESDLASAIRNLLVENRVVLLMSDAESNQREVSGRADANGNRSVNIITDSKFWMAFADTDTGALISMRFGGEGMDNQDKGYAKSSTLAVKYFLMRIFLVPSGLDADDPDRSSTASSPQAASAPSRPTASYQPAANDDTGYAEYDGEVQCPIHGDTWKTWPDGGKSCTQKVNGQWCPWRVNAQGVRWEKK